MDDKKPTLPIPAGQMVNKLGKYLYKNIDGRLSYKTSSNTCDVVIMVLYQLPRLQQIPGKQKEGYNDMHEMHIDINLTTYANKIRVNLIEISPDEKTLGCLIWGPEQLQDLEKSKLKILSKVQKCLIKEYKDYDFIF